MFGRGSSPDATGLSYLLTGKSPPQSRCTACRSKLLQLKYDIDLLLEVAHLGEHQLDIALLALLLERGHAPLQALDLPLQFGLYALESEQVAALPLVLLGVVVCLSLHLLGLVEPHSRGVH